ncbi:MAG: hypothetical protein WCF92_03435 [bacterium]
MSFFSPQKKESSCAVIFLNSGSVEAGIFSSDSKNKINFFIKENLKFVQDINPQILEKETFLALKKILSEIFTINHSEKPDKVFFVLGAPWYISTVISIDIKKNISFFVSKDEIVKELEVKSLENNTDYSVIESKIITILANGYELTELKGKKAKHVFAKAITNISEKKFLQKITSETEKFFPEAQIKIHTIPSISVNEISEKIGSNNFLLALSEDEITEICLVKDNKSIENISVPFGKNTYIRAIINHNLAADSSSANSILKMFEEGHIETAKKQALEKIVVETNSKCLQILKDALFQYINKGNHFEAVAVLSSSKEINHILKNIFNDPYINSIGKNDFVKILLSKNINESALFSSAISGIKSLYF